MNVVKLPKRRLEEIILEEIQKFKLNEVAVTPEAEAANVKAQVFAALQELPAKIQEVTDPIKLQALMDAISGLGV